MPTHTAAERAKRSRADLAVVNAEGALGRAEAKREKLDKAASAHVREARKKAKTKGAKARKKSADFMKSLFG